MKYLYLILIAFCLSVTPVVASQVGGASYYGSKFDGKRTASGQIFRSNQLTAAHRTHRFGTRLKVTNLKNGKSVIVIVNDRGPFVKGRIIDLSKAAARKIGIHGLGKVKIEKIQLHFLQKTLY